MLNAPVPVPHRVDRGRSIRPNVQSNANKAATADTVATMHREGEWRTSKLVGVNVYNEANEKIGDINDVILDKAGKVENVVPWRRRLSWHG